MFNFLSDSIYHLMKFCEKKIDLDKMQSYLEVQICRHFGPPFAPVLPWFEMSFDVDSRST